MVEFKAILSVEEAIAAVKRDGYALQYVFEKSLFVQLAEKFEIPINIKDPTANAA